MSEELHHLTIARGSSLIRSGALSPVAWIEHLLARIAALDPVLDAFVRVTGERALAQARAAENEIARGAYRGPLHGVPYAAKDIYDTGGIATTGGSRVCQFRVPERDATTVSRLGEAGAVLLGKLTTHEFAYGGPSFDLPWPPARNPWDVRRFSGGSSSGSGAAVAAGLVPVALGSDTAGSIRQPAAFCGVAGMKPTPGLVSRAGVLPFSQSTDVCGPLAWTVEDCAIVLGALAGFDANDPQSADAAVPDFRAVLDRDIRGARIGVVRHFHQRDRKADPAITRALDDALAVLAGLGAEIEDVTLSALDDFAACLWVITCAEMGAVHGAGLRARPGDFGENFRYRTVPGAAISAVDYVQAQRHRQALIAEVGRAFDRFDALVTATVPTPAPLFEDVSLVSAFASRGINHAFSAAAVPALAVCCGFTDQGLPLSLTVAGRAFDDAGVLKIGHAYETACSWRERRPSIDATVRLPPGPGPETPAPGASGPPAELLAAWAEMPLDARQRDQLAEALPYIDGMIERVFRNHAYEDEPANAFEFAEGRQRR
ncbi:MAG: amidase [Rhodospirillales bacterium]|nr:amidase [Rhodospirillales bacterium]